MIQRALRRHEAKSYTDEVEAEMYVVVCGFPVFVLIGLHSLEAMSHPRCVGWGEIGLDYYYNLSPPEVQREVFTRQLRQATKLGKPLTIHTREAEEDMERILKTEVPQSHRVSNVYGCLSSYTNSYHVTCRFMCTASPTRPSSLNDCWIIFRTFTSALQVYFC